MMMDQILGSLQLTWETWVEFFALGFSFLPWLLWVSLSQLKIKLKQQQ